MEADADQRVGGEPEEPYTLIRVEKDPYGWWWRAYYWSSSGKEYWVELDYYDLPYRYHPQPHDEVWALKAAIYRLGQLKRKARSRDERRKKAEQG